MRKKWVIVDTGCIECGESTEVIGVYSKEEEAKNAYKAYCEDVEASQFGDYFIGGQRQVEIHELTKNYKGKQVSNEKKAS